MTSLATFLVRHRWPVFAATALLTLGAAWRGAQLDIDLSFKHFFPVADQAGRDRPNGNRSVPVASETHLVALLVAPQDQDVFQRPVLDVIADLTRAVADIPHVEQVTSLVTVFFLGDLDRDVAIGRIGPLVEGGVQPAVLKPLVAGNPLYLRRVVSADSRLTAVLARLDPTHQGVAARRPTLAAFRQAVDKAAAQLPDFRVEIAGYPIAEAETASLLERGFVHAELVATALITLMLAACFRTAAGVVLPLLIVTVSTILTLGFMHTVGLTLTLTNISIPLLILVIGVAEVSFFLSRYYEEAAHQPAPAPELAVRTASSVLFPALLAAATTCAGFLSLTVANLGLTRDFGLMMTAGTACTFLVAAAVLPGLLAMLPTPPARVLRAVTHGRLAGVLAGVVRMNIDHRWAVFGGVGVIVALVIIGGRALTIEQFATGELPPDHATRRVQRLLDESLMGSFEVKVLVQSRDGTPLTTPERLAQLDRLQGFFLRSGGVIHAWSLLDYLKELERQADGVRRLPADQQTLDAQLAALFDIAPPDDLPQLAARRGEWAVIRLGITDLGAERLLQLERTMQAVARDSDLDVRFTGDYWLVSRGVSSLVRDLIASTITAFVLVFVLVMLFLRSWKLTLLAIPPNLLPLGAALGVMGLTGLPLRVGTSIILPMALGVAVDATIHLLARFREEWLDDGDYEGAIRRALTGTGRAMVFSGAVLVSGFLAYLIPDFATFRHIAIVASSTLLVALLADLFLAPSLLLWMRPLGEMGAER